MSGPVATDLPDFDFPPLHPRMFADPAALYRPDLPPVCRRAAAVADLLDATAADMTGDPPPNFAVGVENLLAVIGDKELTILMHSGRHHGAIGRMHALAVEVRLRLGEARAALG